MTNTGFELTEEQLSTIGKAGDYLAIITSFSDWCTKNVEIIDLPVTYSIMEDFVKSNEHIIKKINKVFLLNFLTIFLYKKLCFQPILFVK